jgi:sterol desaturase/sphingolipid hydroxylase (fatty acid hydroxylase superfamily)
MKRILALAVIVVCFTAIEALWPERRGARWWRRPLATDLSWAAMNGLTSKPLTSFFVVVGLVALAFARGDGLGAAAVKTLLGRPTALSQLPLGAQGLLALLLADLFGYWMHRAFHRPALWRAHAVHHSARALDWLAATRVHPLNEVMQRVATVIPLVWLGFRHDVLAGVAPLLTLWSVVLHANVSWRFGPLRYVIATPAFHRWHHAADPVARDKNFAGLFPLWDLVFGTFYLPPSAPEAYGTPDTPVPEGLLAQLRFGLIGR